jgi:MATE family multidrug resistance protein
MALQPGDQRNRIEFRRTLGLAVPVIIGELGWMAMGVMDTIMLGRVSPEALGAASVGRIVFFTVIVFGMGFLLGLDTYVSTAHGAGQPETCRSYLVQGVHLSLVLAVPMTALTFLAAPALGSLGIDPRVLASAVPYLRALAWSALPLLLYTTFRRYLQGVSRPRPVMLALISANLINLAGNWILIFGNLGAPAMGAEGAGWSSCIAAAYLALFLMGSTWLLHRGNDQLPHGASLWPHLARLRRLVMLGFPSAIQLVAEVGVFAAATALAGRLAPSALAAHQIALTAASVTFMIPLGLSSAGAVRVGQARGRGDREGAKRAGWMAILLAAVFMSVAGVAFLMGPRQVARLFSADETVIAGAILLVRIAALFQLFDGVQVAATGALRGAGDTRTPLIWNLIGHWALGLPVGYYLCFHRDMGAPGLWLGWLVGLGVVGAVLLFAWWRRAPRIVTA